MNSPSGFRARADLDQRTGQIVHHMQGEQRHGEIETLMRERQRLGIADHRIAVTRLLSRMVCRCHPENRLRMPHARADAARTPASGLSISRARAKSRITGISRKIEIVQGVAQKEILITLCMRPGETTAQPDCDQRRAVNSCRRYGAKTARREGGGEGICNGGVFGRCKCESARRRRGSFPASAGSGPHGDAVKAACRRRRHGICRTMLQALMRPKRRILLPPRRRRRRPGRLCFPITNQPCGSIRVAALSNLPIATARSSSFSGLPATGGTKAALEIAEDALPATLREALARRNDRVLALGYPLSVFEEDSVTNALARPADPARWAFADGQWRVSVADDAPSLNPRWLKLMARRSRQRQEVARATHSG